MSFNGSGVAVINSTGQPVSANTLIEASVFNAFTADVATMLSTAICKDGQTTVTADLPMAGNKFTGLGAGSAAGHSLRYEQLFTTSAVTLLGAINWVKGADIASDATINLTTATGNGVHVTGTTTITAVTLGSGMVRLVVFDGILTLTHHATNNNLPGGANITTAAGDRAIYWADGTTVYCVGYIKANGKSVVAPAVGDVTGFGTGVATALAVNVGSAGAPVVQNGALGTPSSGDLSNCTGGGLPAASQAQQEAASSNVVSVTPANQHYHPSAPKAWARFDGTAAGTNAPSKGYNVTSIEKTGTGAYTVNLAITMSDALYAVVVSAPSTANSGNTYYNNIGMNSQTATTFTLKYAVGAYSDPAIVCFAVYGDI